MKIASVVIDGTPTFGAVVDGGFIDLGAERLGPGCFDLADCLAQKLLDRAAGICRETSAERSVDELTFAPVIANSSARVFALGWAYQEHMAETAKEPPEYPTFFSKLPQSLVGHNAPLVKPAVSDAFDYEGEIAIIIGSRGRNIPEEDALSFIAGYSILMDGSVRDWQRHSLTAGKNFDASSSLGPWMVTADEIADPRSELTVTTRLNGQEVQNAPFSDNVWSLAYLIHYLSTFTELLPGDVITTGTPSGVGAKRTPPLFLKSGDVLEVAVSRVGTLRNHVVSE